MHIYEIALLLRYASGRNLIEKQQSLLVTAPENNAFPTAPASEDHMSAITLPQVVH
jgi:hypothetical protein